MTARRVCVVLVLAAGLAVTTAALWGQGATPPPVKPTGDVRPYQVVSGQIFENFQVLYVLDNETRQLAVLKYDWVKDRLLPVAGRNLASDFGSVDSGGYSMATLQMTGSRGILLVTDYAAHKAIAYKVEISPQTNTITPNTPIDLNTMFSK